MNTMEAICSSKTSTISVRVNPNDAETVRFPIVPLRAGKHPIEIVVRSVGVGDWVRKMVNVIVSIADSLKTYVYYCTTSYVYLLLNLFLEQNEGKEERKTVSFWVDPHMQKGRQSSRGDLRVNSKSVGIEINLANFIKHGGLGLGNFNRSE